MLQTNTSYFKRGLLCLALCGLADAGHAADRELLDILLANGAIDQAQYDRLLEKEELTREDADEILVSFDSGGLSVANPAEGFQFNLGGRLHLDYAQHEHVSGLPVEPVNGYTTRRARLEMDGRFNQAWGWAAEVDFAENVVELKDFKLGYEGERFSLYAGNQKIPYSLSLEMSSNDIPWVERSIDNYLVSELTDRAIGLRLESGGERWFLAGGVYGDEVDSGVQGDEGWSTAGRFVYAPIIAAERVLHLGVRAAYRKTGDPLSVRFRDKTTDFSGLNVVNTGRIANADTITMFGPELGVALGPFTLLGEYSAVEVERLGAGRLDFDGWHLGAAWALTGESRAGAYRIDAGEFKGLPIGAPFDPRNGSWGAFEVSARYASLNLNDGAFIGGAEDVVNAGLNWYPAPNVRFLFDWTHILDTDESNTVRQRVPGMDIFTLRAQYNY